MAVADVAPGLVAFPDQAGVVAFGVFHRRVLEGRVPAPGVGARQAHAALEQVHRGLVAHAAAGRHEVVVAVAAAGAGVDDDDLQGLERVADALELGLDVGRRHHVAIGQVAKVQLHAGLKAPLQRHLVDGPGLLLLAQRLVHGAVEVVGRIEVGAVVGRELNLLDRPAFAVGQVFLLQAGKEGLDLADGVFVGEVLDLGREGGRVGDDVVFEVDREVDELAGHEGLQKKNGFKGAASAAGASRPAPAAHCSQSRWRPAGRCRQTARWRGRRAPPAESPGPGPAATQSSRRRR